MTWLGIDVGGPRKGFDAALIDSKRLLALWSGLGRDGVLALARAERPELVAIDSPCGCARPGHTSREGERLLNRKVCGIRWTPDPVEVAANPYYSWVAEGLRLHQALEERGIPAIEVFPTASWTRLLGPRGDNSRAAWTKRGLTALGLDGLPARTSQDARDAIAAAVTGRRHTEGRTESFGEIVVIARELSRP